MRGVLLWLIGIPIPIIILLYLFDVLLALQRQAAAGCRDLGSRRTLSPHSPPLDTPPRRGERLDFDRHVERIGVQEVLARWS